MKNMRPSNLDHETPKDLRENSKKYEQNHRPGQIESRPLSFPSSFFPEQKNRKNWMDPAPVVSGLVHGKKHGLTRTKTNIAPENDGLNNRNLYFHGIC